MIKFYPKFIPKHDYYNVNPISIEERKKKYRYISGTYRAPSDIGIK